MDTNASMYTTMHSVSLGVTAFEPQDKDKVDYQKSDIFEISETDSNTNKEIDNNIDGTVIMNMDSFHLSLAVNHVDMGLEGEYADAMDIEGNEPEVVDMVHSLAKVDRTALIRSGFPTVLSDAQCGNIVKMIQQWIKGNGGHDLPVDLTDLASSAQIVVSNLAVDVTMWRR
jgi:hypothetical protein